MSPSTPNPGPNGKLILPDGRRLAYSDYGDPAGTPVVFAHGMPGSRLEGRFFHTEALRAGFRVLTLDRPGIGASSYQAGRTLLDYPEDLACFLDSLGIGRFIHMGWSSGGSRTLACGRVLGDRVDLAVVLSGYTHFTECPEARSRLLATRWPGPVLAESSPRLFRALVHAAAALGRHRPGLYMREVSQLVSAQDRLLLSDRVLAHHFRIEQMICLSSSGRGIAKDLETELVDWGFRLAEVDIPVWLFQGDADPFIPLMHLRHLNHNLPRARMRILSGAGHLYPLSADFQRGLFGALRRQISGLPVELPGLSPPA